MLGQAASLRRVRVFGTSAPELSQDYEGVPNLRVLNAVVYYSKEAKAAFVRRPSSSGQDVWSITRLGETELYKRVLELNSVHRLVFHQNTPPVEYSLMGEKLDSEAQVYAAPGCSDRVIVEGARQEELNGVYVEIKLELWGKSVYAGPTREKTHFLYETRWFGVYAITPKSCVDFVVNGEDCGDLLFFSDAQACELDANKVWTDSSANFVPFDVLLHVSGAKGPKKSIVNGLYRPSQEEFGDHLVFDKVDDAENGSDWCFAYLQSRRCWMQQSRADKGQFLGSMYGLNSPLGPKDVTSPDQVHVWMVSLGNGQWQRQHVKVRKVCEVDGEQIARLQAEAQRAEAEAEAEDDGPRGSEAPHPESEAASQESAPDPQPARAAEAIAPKAASRKPPPPPPPPPAPAPAPQTPPRDVEEEIMRALLLLDEEEHRSSRRSRGEPGSSSKSPASGAGAGRRAAAASAGEPASGSKAPAARTRAREPAGEEPQREAVIRRRQNSEEDRGLQPPEATLDTEELRTLVATWDSSAGGTNLQDAWQWYERYLKQTDHRTVGLAPLRLRGFKSDFKVAYEVLGRDGYRPPRAAAEFALFDILPGDRVLDGGGNIGAYAHWAVRQGAGHVDVYEPAWYGSTFQQLKRNCSDERFTLHNYGLGVKTGTERLLDFEAARAGASRSTLQALNTYSNRAFLSGSELCEVSVVDFDEVVPGHEVVKLDMEGSELPILDGRHRWDVARVLHVEYSANRCRADEGEPWQRFAASLRRLEEAGWTHVYVPSEVYKQRFWARGGGRGLDFNIWGFREEADPKWGDRVDWKSLDMDGLEELRTKWTHFSTLVLDPAGI